MLSPSRWSIAAVAAVALVIGVSTAASSSSGGPPNPAPDAPDAALLAADVAQSPQDLFTPVTPCRILDTRVTTPMGANTSRTFYVGGTSGFAPQGGKTGGCGIPLDATAIAATVLSVGSSATGRVTLYPAGGVVPTATTLYFSKGVTTSTGTTAALKTGVAQSLSIRAYVQTDVVVDVTGYYQHQIYGTFEDDGDLYSGTGNLAAYAHPSTGYYTLKATRDLTGCSVTATSYYYDFNVSAYTSGSFVYAVMVDDAGNPIDYYFHVIVAC